MQPNHLIRANDFCSSHRIDLSFVQSLSDHGLVHLQTMDEQFFIEDNQLYLLERAVRLHYELEINLEGIEAIMHLLGRVENMQNEIQQLRNRLGMYEE